mgnify:CR=1 FL=1
MATKNDRAKRNDRGFTLAELLIVVAIIAVLVAVAIPVFSSQLENARQETTIANLRSAYAQAAAAAMSADKTQTADSDKGQLAVTVDGSGKKTVIVPGVVYKNTEKLTEDHKKELPFTLTTSDKTAESSPVEITFEITAGGTTATEK